MTWHPSPDSLRRYTDNEIDVASALSVEAHLLVCEDCRAGIASSVDQDRLQRLWAEIEVSLSAPRPSPAERLLMRTGIGDHAARLLSATPSLRRSWLLALAAVLAFAVGAAHASDYGYVLFLLLAPLLPLAGIAGAYGPRVDPTYEIGLASPMRSFRLLLIRASAVLVTTLVMVAVGAVLLPGLDWKVAAWLLPSLGLVMSSLALSTLIQPLWAAATVAGCWLLAVGAGLWLASAPDAASSVFGEPMQVAFLLVTLATAVVLSLRRDVFEREGQTG